MTAATLKIYYKTIEKLEPKLKSRKVKHAATLLVAIARAHEAIKVLDATVPEMTLVLLRAVTEYEKVVHDLATSARPDVRIPPKPRIEISKEWGRMSELAHGDFKTLQRLYWHVPSSGPLVIQQRPAIPIESQADVAEGL